MHVLSLGQEESLEEEMATHSSIVVFQLVSRIWLSAVPQTGAHQVSLSFTISLSLLKLMSLELVMTSHCLILCDSLLFLPSMFPSIRVFSSEPALCIRWPKCWRSSFSINPSNEYSGLISFRIEWFDLLAVQGALKKSSPAPLWKHRFFSAKSTLWSNSCIHTWLLEKLYSSILTWEIPWRISQESCRHTKH